MAQTFILSDESVNSHGDIVKTEGIDITRFLKNPVMLYNHSHEYGIIGRWEKLRIENGALIADAVFDEQEEYGKRIKEKLEQGFINSVSIAINVVEEHEEQGINVIYKSELVEVSIVDIPSNKNAVKNFKNGSKTLYFSYQQKTQNKSLRFNLIQCLSLATNDTDTDILNSVKQLKINSENEIEKAFKMGLIDGKEKDLLTFSRDKTAVTDYLSKAKIEAKKEIDDILRNDKKLNPWERQWYHEIGEKLGIKMLKNILKNTPSHKLIDQLQTNENIRSGWTLDDYRKKAPEELKNKPGLYKALMEQEKIRKQLKNNN